MAENFIVSARKYRPDNWDSVVGQKSITTTLRNAIETNQIAQAYLFTGSRGVGKTSCARIFAKAINNMLDATPEELAFTIFELDAASNNSVEDIRSIVDTVRIPPQVGKYKVYVIDEVHMLSSNAFNAFLKTLEEPPAHAIFILATTEKHKIIPTILSRCQIFDFNRIKVKDMTEHLQHICKQEGIVAEEDALHIIATKADGAMRDALSIFDQVVAFCGRKLTYDLVIQNLNVLDYEYYFKLTDLFFKEDIRSIVDTVRIPPQVGKYKVYVIDEVHMLSSNAFNAFLKTLEEPPAHAIFILATTEKHKIIPTILSRCQIFDFNRIKVKDMTEHLQHICKQEGIEAEEDALHIIATKADGAMRDALSIFDQVVAFCGRKLTYDLVIQNLNVLDYEYYFKLTDLFFKEDIPSALMVLNEVVEKGFDVHHFVTGLGAHFRNLLVCRDAQTLSLMEVSEGVAAKYKDQAAASDLRFLIQGIDLVNDTDYHYKSSRHPRLLVELLLMKLCSVPQNLREGEKKK